MLTEPLIIGIIIGKISFTNYILVSNYGKDYEIMYDGFCNFVHIKLNTNQLD